ncbi:hypothetical protein ACIFOC_00483 [Leucobacter aridicollis]|uniref:hypothetical protein n=1 Tax=Leucobacter aridicollis TaxID=283878 RepID=UPI0037C68C14
MIVASISWPEIASAIADVVVALFTVIATFGVFFVIRQLRLQHKQLHRDLENLYVERYWSIRDRLDAAEPGTKERERAAVAYLSLSEDQCDMRMQDRVTDETWVIWAPSIYGALHEEEYADILERQPTGRFLHLREMKTTGAKYDPSNLTQKQRQKIGL